MTNSQPTKDSSSKIKYRLVRMALIVLIFLLLVSVVVIPGVLRILYRADAQVALGHAKSVRLALQIAGTEGYGRNNTFCDASHEGGVAESVWDQVVRLSKAPGEFWVMQVKEDGYTVEKFVYQEGEYTVWYQADPNAYTVYHDETMIKPFENE